MLCVVGRGKRNNKLAGNTLPEPRVSTPCLCMDCCPITNVHSYVLDNWSLVRGHCTAARYTVHAVLKFMGKQYEDKFVQATALSLKAQTKPCDAAGMPHDAFAPLLLVHAKKKP